MRKLVFICLCILFFSCENGAQKASNVEAGNVSFTSNPNHSELCSALYDLYFIYFHGGVDENSLEIEVNSVCRYYGFHIDYHDSCEVSQQCREYSEQIKGASYVSMDELLFMFNDDVLTNVEKLLLCIDAAAVNYVNQYLDVLLVVQTNTGGFLIENNPLGYMQENDINITSQYAIIYQPYNVGAFNVLNFSNFSDLDAYVNRNYSANEDTEDDCLRTYKERVEQANEDLIEGFLGATVYLIEGPEAYALALACHLVVYAERRMEYWRDYTDCLESIQKVVFIHP